MANATASGEVGQRTVHSRFVSGTRRLSRVWNVTMLSSPNVLLWRGLPAVVIGMVSVTWPGITVGAFVILFAVYAFMSAATDAARAFAGDRVGPVLGWLLLALLSLAAGVIALAWPGITALALTIWIAAWALTTGVMEIVLAFQRGEKAGERALFLLTGLVSIAFAFVLFVRPDIGAVSLATVFGLFSIVYGVSAVFASFEERRRRTYSSRPEPTRADPCVSGSHGRGVGGAGTCLPAGSGAAVLGHRRRVGRSGTVQRMDRTRVPPRTGTGRRRHRLGRGHRFGLGVAWTGSSLLRMIVVIVGAVLVRPFWRHSVTSAQPPSPSTQPSRPALDPLSR
jgi:uncharacterized membrane protein HdeD (DUF308 family)